jgi:hypothetical protein
MPRLLPISLWRAASKIRIRRTHTRGSPALPTTLGQQDQCNQEYSALWLSRSLWLLAFNRTL